MYNKQRKSFIVRKVTFVFVLCRCLSDESRVGLEMLHCGMFECSTAKGKGLFFFQVRRAAFEKKKKKKMMVKLELLFLLLTPTPFFFSSFCSLLLS